MISVIVCSVQPEYLEQLKINLGETIGVGYELLAYDNRQAKKGICSVYNELASKAKYDLLCFAHEDILFKSQSWGETLISNFNNDIGVLGVAGSKYKSAMFSGWYTGNNQLDCANILHKFPDHEEKIYLNPSKNSFTEEVVCLDGVFICCKKTIWEELLFDDKNLRGFHFYDIDFSVRCSKKYKVAVSFEIDIVHITKGGDFGDKWVETAMEYHKRHETLLPILKLRGSSKEIETNIAKTTLDVLKKPKITWANKTKWITSQKLYDYPSLYYSIAKFLFYGPLKLNVIHKLFK